MTVADHRAHPPRRIAAPRRAVGCLLALLTLAGCAAPTGDFGRPEPNIVNDRILPFAGRNAARMRGEPVSDHMLTDDEKELRRRTYRLVMPIHRDAFFAKAETELVRTRVWPDAAYRVDPTLYYRRLVKDRYESSAGRWNAVETSMLQDLPLIQPYLFVAQDVCLADAARLSALDVTPGLTTSEYEDATARVYENRRVMVWATTALQWRVESYAYAIERTQIEIPSPAQAAARMALDALTREADAFDAAIAAMRCEAGGAGLAAAGAASTGPVYKR